MSGYKTNAQVESPFETIAVSPPKGLAALKAKLDQDQPTHAAQQNGQHGAERLGVSGESGKSALTIRSVKEILAMTFDDSDNYFCDRILAAGQACTLLGPGGVGKSRLAMQLAVCMILGRPFVSFPTQAPDKKWLFIQTENNNCRLNYDLQNMVRSFQLSDEEIQRLNAHLFIHTIETDDDIFLNLMEPENRARIHTTIQSIDPHFIAWDPLNSMTDEDLNSDWNMRAVVMAISTVSRAGNPNRVPLVLHHSLTGKAGAAKAVGFEKTSYGRNSKVLQAWTRAQINLAPRSPDDPNLLIISCGKNNNGRMFPEAGLRFDPESGVYRDDENFDGEQFRAEVGLQKRVGANSKKTKEDLKALVPLTGVIPKNALISKAQTNGMGANRTRGFISELISDGDLFPWDLGRRSRTNHEVGISRFVQTPVAS